MGLLGYAESEDRACKGAQFLLSIAGLPLPRSWAFGSNVLFGVLGDAI